MRDNDLKVILDNLSFGDSTVIDMSDVIYIIYILITLTNNIIEFCQSNFLIPSLFKVNNILLWKLYLLGGWLQELLYRLLNRQVGYLKNMHFRGFSNCDDSNCTYFGTTENRLLAICNKCLNLILNCATIKVK